MSLLNICMNVGSFNVTIKIDKDRKKINTNISRKIDYEKRIKEAIENGVYLPIYSNDLNNLF